MSNNVDFIKHDRTIPTDNWYKIGYFLSIGDEKGAAKIIDHRLGNAGHMQQRALLFYMDSFTDKKLLFNLILSVYTNDGYDFPKKIIQKTKQLAKDIPENQRLHGLQSDERFIRVWRGTTVKDPEAASLLCTSISWTTDKSVAIFFANRCGGVVWEGIIDRKKIIAFCQDRNESEVLQHMNTIDIVDNNEADQTDEEPEDNKVPLQRYVDQQQAYREELYQKVWERPVSEVAKDYSISDNALRKRCINLDIPLPERGYWAKLKAGKTVHKEKLPKLTTNFPRPHTGEKRKLHIETDALSFMERKGRLEIFELASVLRVGGISSKMLDAAQKMADDFKEWHKPIRDTYSPGGYWIPGRRTMSEPPFLANDISTKTASRAFHILDAIDRALKPYLGSLTYQYTQNSDKQYIFSVNGEEIPFSISEGKDKIIHEITQAERLEQIKYEEARSKGHYASKPNIPKYEHPWNGKLKITVAGIYDFVDCKAYVLEDRIGEILIAFFEASYSARLRRLQEEEKRRKEHEEYLRRERIKELYNNEVDKTNALLNKTADFEIACRIRRYIDAIKNDPSNPDNNPDWIDWASKKADWIDPTVAREDEFFGKRKHGQDADQKELKRRW